MQPLSLFLKLVSQFCAVFGSIQPHLWGGSPSHFWKPGVVLWPVAREPCSLTLENSPRSHFRAASQYYSDLLPAHPASFAHKFLFQPVPASIGMQKYGRLVIKNSVLDSLVCSGDSLILDVGSPRTHKPKIVNESLHYIKHEWLLFRHHWILHHRVQNIAGIPWSLIIEET